MKKYLAILLVFTLVLSFSACGTVNNANSEENISVEQNTNAATKDTEPAATNEQEETTEQTKAQESGLVDGMRPEFKEAMDAYEDFYEDYVAFMKKYKANPTDLSLLSDYADMMADAADMDKKFKTWDQGEMNSAELSYYMDVNARVLKMLADVM